MSTDRRDFIKTAAILSSAVALGTSSMKALAPVNNEAQKSNHTLPPLPYPYTGLEPYIDATTVELHHDKHHAAYVQNLNKAENELAQARAKNDYSMVDYWTKKVAFNGAGHFLHTIYWNTMAPKSSKQASDFLVAVINESFGNMENFKNQFSAVAKSVEGSGWALLGASADWKLHILLVEKHENMSYWNLMPVLALDVWEHAYYLKYQNKRADYIAAWWNIVNWDTVEHLIKQAGVKE